MLSVLLVVTRKESSITEICPLDLIPESCDIVLMIQDAIKARVHYRKMKILFSLQSHVISNLHDFLSSAE